MIARPLPRFRRNCQFASGHANASRGRLCEIVTRSGTAEQTTTRYQWDAFGRLTQQEQLISSALASHHQSLSTRYTHVASGSGQGELATITYPIGAVLTHQYSASGQLSGLLWNGQPLLQNITLGQFTTILQSLYQRSASGAWVLESVPHTAAYDALNTAPQWHGVRVARVGKALPGALEWGHSVALWAVPSPL